MWRGPKSRMPRLRQGHYSLCHRTNRTAGRIMQAASDWLFGLLEHNQNSRFQPQMVSGQWNQHNFEMGSKQEILDSPNLFNHH